MINKLNKMKTGCRLSIAVINTRRTMRLLMMTTRVYL